MTSDTITEPLPPYPLPAGLPVPHDDGACDHLLGMTVPPVRLPATSGREVDLSGELGQVLAYIYPQTATPGATLPDGYDLIPGARGCNEQSCSYRDLITDFSALGVTIFGISTQTPAEQMKAAAAFRLPFELLSDEHFCLSTALNLPLFETGGKMRIRRLTLIIRNGQIRKVFYPSHPPNTHAKTVLQWLQLGGE